tara:strand:+ start:3570 stop:4145 length:576 start_codon:yes stop_codon:yes gene_type:complete
MNIEEINNQITELTNQVDDNINTQPKTVPEGLFAEEEPEFDQGGKKFLKSITPGRADLPLAFAAAGVASSISLGAAVNKFLPTQLKNVALESGITAATIGQLIAGWSLYKLSAPLLGKTGAGKTIVTALAAFGGGVTIAALTQIVQKYGLYYGTGGLIGGNASKKEPSSQEENPVRLTRTVGYSAAEALGQ